jgi:TctA family transporter
MEYVDAFVNALLNILPFSSQGQQAFLFMLIGIFIGFWVGILPGLGGAATLALMLPFIYNMDPTSAFAFLLGSNAVTATTGDITSILFGVPGGEPRHRPSSMATRWPKRAKRAGHWAQR